MIDFLEIRFILALFCIYTISYIKPKSLKIRLLFAVIILYVAYGLKNTSYAIFCVLTNLIFLRCQITNKYIVILSNIASIYLYKIFGIVIDPRIRSTFDITGFLMILTVKMGYICLDYNQNIFDAAEYLLFIPGLVTGPTTNYSIFLKTNRLEQRGVPTFQTFLTLVFGFFYVVLKKIDFLKIIKDKESGLLRRLTSLFLHNFGGRCKFYFAWYFADCCFMMNNLNEFLNISFKNVEFCESVSEISTNWNRFMSVWLKTLFFDPIRKKSKGCAIVCAFFVSAALHGFNLCYFIFTLSFAYFTNVVKRINLSIKYKWIRIIQMIGFVSYFSMPFYLLDLKELYAVWSNFYFYGHVYLLTWMLCFKIKDMINNQSVSSKINNNDEIVIPVKIKLD